MTPTEESIVNVALQGVLNPNKGITHILGAHKAGKSYHIELAYEAYKRHSESCKLPAVLVRSIDDFDKSAAALEETGGVLFCLFEIGTQTARYYRSIGIRIMSEQSFYPSYTNNTDVETVSLSTICPADEVLSVVERYCEKKNERGEFIPQCLRSREGLINYFVSPFIAASSIEDDNGELIGTVFPSGLIISVFEEFIITMTLERSNKPAEYAGIIANSVEGILNCSDSCLIGDPRSDVAVARVKSDDEDDLLDKIRSDIKELVVGSTNTPKSSKPVKALSINNPNKIRKAIDDLIAGQDAAMSKVVSLFDKPYAFPLGRPHRPVFSALFCGPTGVGKTETAKILAASAFDEPVELIRIDCSEFSERHEVAKLYGAPPGYTGYDDGGKLTNAVRENPNAVVLLDEVEKAHPSIWDTFLQVLDDGFLTDGSGKKVSFKNTVIILTSNLGTKNMNKNVLGFGDTQSVKSIKSSADAEMREYFRPEFLNRLDSIVYFDFLSDEAMAEIVRIKSEQVLKQFESNKVRVRFNLGDLTSRVLSKVCKRDYGAREIVRLLDAELSTPIANYIVNNGRRASGITYLTVDYLSDGGTAVSSTRPFQKGVEL